MSEETSRSRRNLLIASATAIVVFHLGLVPTQIDGLGVTFSEWQQSAFLSCLLVLISFQLAGFTLGSVTDYYGEKLRRKAYTEDELYKSDLINKSESFEEMRATFDEIFNPLEADESMIGRIQTYRIVYEILLTYAVAIYAIVVLIWKLCG